MSYKINLYSKFQSLLRTEKILKPSVPVTVQNYLFSTAAKSVRPRQKTGESLDEESIKIIETILNQDKKQQDRIFTSNRLGAKQKFIGNSKLIKFIENVEGKNEEYDPLLRHNIQCSEVFKKHLGEPPVQRDLKTIEELGSNATIRRWNRCSLDYKLVPSTPFERFEQEWKTSIAGVDERCQRKILVYCWMCLSKKKMFNYIEQFVDDMDRYTGYNVTKTRGPKPPKSPLELFIEDKKRQKLSEERKVLEEIWKKMPEDEKKIYFELCDENILKFNAKRLRWHVLKINRGREYYRLYLTETLKKPLGVPKGNALFRTVQYHGYYLEKHWTTLTAKEENFLKNIFEDLTSLRNEDLLRWENRMFAEDRWDLARFETVKNFKKMKKSGNQE